MEFSSEILPNSWLWIGHFIYALLLGAALWRLSWHHLFDSYDSHIFFASWILLWLVWRQGGGITEGMEFHLLMVTSVTLMFGWQYALITVSMAQLGLSIEGKTEWFAYSINVLCNGAIPIFITYGLYRLKYILMPRHFIIYIYIAAFFGGALSMLASRLTGMGLLLLSGTYTWLSLGNEPLFIMAMLFPEAFLNGLVMTVLVAYRPEWVSSFSDNKYLNNK
ncbi:energy-coupling factor ABC transporter permease [Candidatus Albibeggiatoa sp. nov. BB20]|uniref:energy-coupling factor ABC transporter permease n=1 Tax=Candidatus Albibeggiatoa sp. nov. BB20 TaxID=3162723 RepID=UPI003365A61C